MQISYFSHSEYELFCKNAYFCVGNSAALESIPSQFLGSKSQAKKNDLLINAYSVIPVDTYIFCPKNRFQYIFDTLRPLFSLPRVVLT